jgi:eukaryotic-like serine/threonine-protein kinase
MASRTRALDGAGDVDAPETSAGAQPLIVQAGDPERRALVGQPMRLSIVARDRNRVNAAMIRAKYSRLTVLWSLAVLAVGTLVAEGKFRIDRVIGRGGMAMVVGATHLRLDQPVALKVLLPDLVPDHAVVERFVREARASAQLRGEHVCRVSDVGTLEDDAPYIVMELLEGSDLASLVQAGPLSVELAAEYMLQACVGVAEAHALGIVHRDLKPANLFLTRRPDDTPLIKVLDFGVAKAGTVCDFTLTETRTVLGSPSYMSPEQLRSAHDVDVRSDIWSFGVILYELISGRRPFHGESITDLALHIAMDPTPALAGRIPHGFEPVVKRCLAKDPAERYPDLESFANALAPHAGPTGRELAAGVARLLHRTARALHDSGPRARSASAPGVQAPVAITQVSVDTGAGAAAPTTMGAAAGAIATATPCNRRRGVITGMTVTLLISAAVTAAIVSGTGGTVTGTSAASAPAASADKVVPATEPADTVAQPVTAQPSGASASPASPGSSDDAGAGVSGAAPSPAHRPSRQRRGLGTIAIHHELRRRPCRAARRRAPATALVACASCEPCP